MIAIRRNLLSTDLPASRWRVRVLGRNGEEVVLDRDLTRERAEELRRMLISCDLFQDIEIEAEAVTAE